MTPRNDTERVRRQYDRTAGRYDDLIGFAERVLFGGGREWVCSRARGEVLEIAAGTGRNIPFYAEDVKLTAIELSPAMLEIARGRAETLGREADLRVGDAQVLPFPDARFDAVVCTLGLCTIPSPQMAVREAARVLKPGGRLLTLEHVRSPLLPVCIVQAVLNPITVLAESDHLLREPLAHVAEAGLVVETLERSKLGIVERLEARKPASQVEFGEG